jgi:hypothetical protein
MYLPWIFKEHGESGGESKDLLDTLNNPTIEGNRLESDILFVAPTSNKHLSHKTYKAMCRAAGDEGGDVIFVRR